MGCGKRWPGRGVSTGSLLRHGSERQEQGQQVDCEHRVGLGLRLRQVPAFPRVLVQTPATGTQRPAATALWTATNCPPQAGTSFSRDEGNKEVLMKYLDRD